MNWIDNFVRPKIRSFLNTKRDTPENLWVKDPESGEMVFYRDLEANQWVVPNSGYHMKIKPVDRLATFLDRTVAVSRPFHEPGARPAAEAAARATLEAAEQLPAPPRVVRASRLPAYLLLGNVRNLPDGVRQARELLAPILVGRDETQRERLDTLAAVLSSPSLADAAARLGVHRNTIAYRVQRLEARGDWDLSDPELRVALMLAVRVMQNAQEKQSPPVLNRNPSG